MDQYSSHRAAFTKHGWFEEGGAYVITDGQFGSTGKGSVAALIGYLFGDVIDVVTTNAGPNSGHTGYFVPPGLEAWEKVVTRQLPVAGVVARRMGHDPYIYLNAGAIIDPAVLQSELIAYGLENVGIHPCAAIIEPIDMVAEQDDGSGTGPAAVASTGKGVGSALARKIMRRGNIARIAASTLDEEYIRAERFDPSDVMLVETAQGFSLGINSEQFYPYVTSRECTVMQAMADARIGPRNLRKVLTTFRTFPIRVGNTPVGYSGGHYPDQKETSWQALGVAPELTTVTGRERRVFTWSNLQFIEAVQANHPDVLFLSFMDYIPKEKHHSFLIDILALYYRVMDRYPDFILTGHGPYLTDIKVAYTNGGML